MKREELVDETLELRRRITELETAEAEYRLLKEKLILAKGEWERTFDTVPDLIAIIDNQYSMVRVNKALADKLGVSPKEIVGRPCYEAFCGSHEPPLECPHRRTLVDGKESTAEILMGRLGGDYLVTVSPFRDGDGKVTGSVYVARDITERKLAEQERETSRRFLQSVIDGVADLIIVFGRDFSVKLMNRAAREFAAGDLSSSSPLFCYQVFFQGTESCSRIEESCPLEEVIETRKPVTVTHACVRRGGGAMFLDIQASPIMDEQGEVVQIIQVCRDVTEKLMIEETRRQLEERLTQEQKEQSISTLAGGIAHDFNNILMGVLGNAELLESRLAPYDKEQTLVQNIIKAGERMADLTKQLMTYAKSTLSQPEVVFLHDMVDEALALTHKGTSLDTEVIVDIPADLWPVFVDPGQMSQVFVNLFTNAFEAMGMAGGLLTIRAENVPDKESWECPTHKRRHPKGDYVYFRVSDTGQGIPKEMLRQIFDPFVTTKFLGRGLGLSAAFGIIQSHNGCISVESDLGQGATFHIYLQRAQTGEGKRKAERKKAASSQILIVDDEPQVLSLLEMVLTHAGYRVLAARNGEEALRLFGDRKDDVEMAILDIQMPGMGGKRLFAELRALKPSLKVLISSGYDEKTALKGIEHYSLEGFIQKPYLSGVLEGKVREILRGENAPRG